MIFIKVNFLSKTKHSLYTKETLTPFNLLYINDLKWGGGKFELAESKFTSTNHLCGLLSHQPSSN